MWEFLAGVAVPFALQTVFLFRLGFRRSVAAPSLETVIDAEKSTALTGMEKSASSEGLAVQHKRRLKQSTITTLYDHAQRESCIWANALLSHLFSSQLAHVRRKVLKALDRQLARLRGRIVAYRLFNNPPTIRTISANVENGKDFYFFILDICGRDEAYFEVAFWKDSISLQVSLDFEGSEWRVYVEHHRKTKELFFAPVPRERSRLPRIYYPFFNDKHVKISINDNPFRPFILVIALFFLNLYLSLGYPMRINLRNTGSSAPRTDSTAGIGDYKEKMTKNDQSSVKTEDADKAQNSKEKPVAQHGTSQGIKSRLQSFSMKLYKRTSNILTIPSTTEIKQSNLPGRGESSSSFEPIDTRGVVTNEVAPPESPPIHTIEKHEESVSDITGNTILPAIN